MNQPEPWHATRSDEDVSFEAPWQASVFAILLHLVERGHISWSEWNSRFAKEIANSGADGSGYFVCWLDSVERLLEDKRLLNRDELQGMIDQLRIRDRH